MRVRGLHQLGVPRRVIRGAVRGHVHGVAEDDPRAGSHGRARMRRRGVVVGQVAATVRDGRSDADTYGIVVVRAVVVVMGGPDVDAVGARDSRVVPGLPVNQGGVVAGDVGL